MSSAHTWNDADDVSVGHNIKVWDSQDCKAMTLGIITAIEVTVLYSSLGPSNVIVRALQTFNTRRRPA